MEELKAFELDHYEAVVFDFDMTLADTSHVIVDLLNETVQAFGYGPKEYDQLLPVVGNTHMVMLAAASGESDAEKLLVMQEHYRMLCRQRMPEETTFYPYVLPCIQWLFEKRKKLGILSQKLRGLLMASLEKYDMEKYFSCVIGGDDDIVPKPDPDGLFRASRLLNVEKDKILYMGDSLIDEKTAVSAGVDFCVMLLGGTKPEQFTSANVKRMFADWQEFKRLFVDDQGGMEKIR